MESIRHHSVSVLILTDEPERALVGLYDDSYPVEFFRGHFNLLGGNSREDSSPLTTLTRELTEELTHISARSDETVGAIIGSVTADQSKNDAPLRGRIYTSPALRHVFLKALFATLTPHRDYQVQIEKEYVKTPHNLRYLTSVYLARIDCSLFNELDHALSIHEELTDEGYTRIVSTHDLRRGTIRGAWGYATIIGEILGIPSIPEYPFIKVVPLEGKIRNTFQDYKKDFMYQRDPEC